jgi:hypothetical protein
MRERLLDNVVVDSQVAFEAGRPLPFQEWPSIHAICRHRPRQSKPELSQRFCGSADRLAIGSLSLSCIFGGALPRPAAFDFRL